MEEKKELDWLTKTVIEAIGKYYTETVEVTKTVRIPKGATCDCCVFKKYENYGNILPNGDCCNSGYAWCALYGERLQINGGMDIRTNPILGLLPTNWHYSKCKGCLEDTKQNEKETE